MPLLTAAPPDFQIFPTDVYDALCKEITVEQKKADKYHDKDYEQLRCRNVIKVDDDDEPDGYAWKTWTFWCDLKAGAGGKLNKFRAALNLPPVEAGEPFDTDEMTDIYFRVSLSDVKRDGSPGQQILGFLPAKRNKTKGKATQQVIDEVTEDAPDDDEVPF